MFGIGKRRKKGDAIEHDLLAKLQRSIRINEELIETNKELDAQVRTLIDQLAGKCEEKGV